MSANKNEIYDKHIEPLVKQLVEQCKEHGVAMVARFDISTEEQPGLGAISMTPDGNGDYPLPNRMGYDIMTEPDRVVARLFGSVIGSVASEAVGEPTKSVQ